MRSVLLSLLSRAPPRLLLRAGKEVSPWHDIPLFAENGLLHYVCEIPKETAAKMECATVRPVTDSHPVQAHAGTYMRAFCCLPAAWLPLHAGLALKLGHPLSPPHPTAV